MVAVVRQDPGDDVHVPRRRQSGAGAKSRFPARPLRPAHRCHCRGCLGDIGRHLRGVPQTFVYFGILHAIAAASVIGLPFVATRLWLCAAAIAFMFAAPQMFAAASFDTRWLAWTGLAANPPASNDLVPILPSTAFTLLGVFAARLLEDRRWTEGRQFQSIGRSAFLVWAGRNSLAIYLLHQPILLAIIVPAADLAGRA